MKVFAAATVSESGDHALFVSLNEDGIAEQIIEMGRDEYGDDIDNETWPDLQDEYMDYDHYLLSLYQINEGTFDV